MSALKPAVAARMVAAVRADHIVGRGTCSPIDECYDDAELVAQFERWEATTVRQAVAEARRSHRIWADRFAELSGSEGW